MPGRGARTTAPTGAARSTPRCPVAHGCAGPSNGCTTVSGSTGEVQDDPPRAVGGSSWGAVPAAPPVAAAPEVAPVAARPVAAASVEDDAARPAPRTHVTPGPPTGVSRSARAAQTTTRSAGGGTRGGGGVPVPAPVARRGRSGRIDMGRPCRAVAGRGRRGDDAWGRRGLRQPVEDSPPRDGADRGWVVGRDLSTGARAGGGPASPRRGSRPCPCRRSPCPRRLAVAPARARAAAAVPAPARPQPCPRPRGRSRARVASPWFPPAPAPPPTRRSASARPRGPVPGFGSRPVDSPLRPVRAGRHRASSPRIRPVPLVGPVVRPRAGVGSGPGSPGVDAGVAPGVPPVLDGTDNRTSGSAQAGPRSVCAPPTWARREDVPWPS